MAEKLKVIVNFGNLCILGPKMGVPDSTAEDSTVEPYLNTTLRRSFSQNLDSTAKLEKCGLYGGILVKTHILQPVAPD